MFSSVRVILSAAVLLVVLVSAACDVVSDTPRPAMPVRVTIEPHIPGTLELGVHLRLENLVDESVTVTVEIDSDSLRNEPGGDDLSIHPIFRGDGPVQVTLAPKGQIDFWFTRDQLAAEDPILVTHSLYAAQLARVPADAKRGVVEAIAIGPVE
jgi:hypothetical protein